MSEVKKDVARRLYESSRMAEGEWFDWLTLPANQYDRESGPPKKHWMDLADEAIAAATPHIRAALFDELIADITDRAGTANIHMYSDVDETGQFITESLYFDEWIAELKNKENTQP